MKKWLLLYHSGARGDFLNSILFGDILLQSYKNPWIIVTGTDQTLRMHGYNEVYSPHYTFTKFEDFNVLRIKAEDKFDIMCIAKLATHKLMKDSDIKYDNVLSVSNFENTFSKLDFQFQLIVPFKKLFDIEYINKLFYQIRNNYLTPEEQDRILYNIKLNLDILDSYNIEFKI